ncbi:hypothetical protein ACSRUE_36610 [Sorangium sp. KYC3313]|uniref:hypothetical protein n=1 Tax=Sorangium sp. KYC3313 TaxID=3449740 RepID=UPI003F8C14F8
MTTSPGGMTMARRPMPTGVGRMPMGAGRMPAGLGFDADVSIPGDDGSQADDDDIHLR